MHGCDCDRLTDRELTRTLSAEVARERGATARVLALIAEVDVRRLYLPSGYPSMHHYCVRELGYSEDAAYKRIQAARVARRFPALLAAVAGMRLHLTGVGLLAPHLTRENADKLITAAAGRTKAEIEEMLAQRFPRTELMPLVESLPGRGDGELAPAQVGVGASAVGNSGNSLAPAQVATPSTAGGAPVAHDRLTPIATRRFALHLTIDGSTHQKLRHAQELLSHELPSGSLARVLDLALDALVEKLGKRKYARSERPRGARQQASSDPRHIPACVKRAVWARDGGRCTFVGDGGRRCDARKFLEFDHVEPVARGGRATVAGIRLRCRAHNQYEADRVFGADFMRAKRETGRMKAEPPARTPAKAPSQECTRAPSHASLGSNACPNGLGSGDERANELQACLRQLGFRAHEVRGAIETCMTIPEATLEERVRTALRYLAPRPRRAPA